MIKHLYEQGLHTTHQLSGTVQVEGTPLDSLIKLGSLKKYPGATPEGFDGERDGTRKAGNVLRAVR
jgi:hypothetical protein